MATVATQVYVVEKIPLPPSSYHIKSLAKGLITTTSIMGKVTLVPWDIVGSTFYPKLIRPKFGKEFSRAFLK